MYNETSKTYGEESIYLLTSSTNAAKGFSQPYILMTRIPEMTSFMVRILSSVKTAVSALKQQKSQKSYQGYK